MSIKVKIIILAVFSLVVTAMTGSILFQNSNQAREEIIKQGILIELLNKLSERAILRDEYLLYRGERAVIQWKVIARSIDKLLTQTSNVSPLPDEQILINKISDNDKATISIFGNLVTNFNSQDNGPSATISEFEQRLISQIRIKSQESIAIASQLSNSSRSRVIESQNRTTLFVGVFFASSTIIILVVLYFIWLSIAKPLLVLKESAIRIASLDFSSTTTTTTGKNSNDEIGQLGGAFDQMVVKLREAYQTLETKVRDRTQDLEEAKAKDEAILSSIGDGMVVVDEEGKITYVNQAFEKMVGWKTKEILDKYIVEVVPREDEKGNVVPFKERILTQVLSGEKVTANLGDPFYYFRRDKRRFPAISIIAPIVLDGKTVGAVETFRDITKESHVDKAKTEFVSLASHQMLTPASTISWYAEMLLSGDAGKITNDQRKYLDEIYRGNQRMVKLVSALLNVSRLELGTFMVSPEPTDIAKLAQSVIDEQKPQIEERKITITAKFEKDIPILSVDPNLIRIVFQNLLSNAVKYTPEGGKVTIEIALIEGSKILIKVSDTGFGIPKNQQNQMFTKLFRADNVREKDIGGTGLGLYIVKSIIENSTGKIWFESEENKGSIFYVTLPLEGMKRKVGTKQLS